MKFVIAPDSFKESMTAVEAAEAIEAGFRKVKPDIECDLIPMADGGEGTSECFRYGRDARWIKCRIQNPLGEEINTEFLLLPKEKTAIIEAAKAAGIMLIPQERRNPALTSTYGVGQMIRVALEQDVKNIILTLGGTVTNDGGSGMLQALGAKMLTSDKQSISAGGYGLAELAEVDLSGPRKLLENVTITVLCDVTNSLLGEHGATKVFARQKGATEEMIQNLEEAMENYAEIMDRDCGVDFSTWKGTGAAGGLGYGLLCVSNARFENGCSYIAKALGVEDKIKTCDYVITGEGFIDNQSLNGKVPVGIANIAKLYGKPVIVFAGGRSGSQESFYEQGITSVFTILPGRMNMDELLRTGKDNLTFTAENFMRLLVTEQNRINANNI